MLATLGHGNIFLAFFLLSGKEAARFSPFPPATIAARLGGAMSDDAFAPWQRVRSEPLAEPLVRPTEAGRKFGLGGACHQAYVDAEMGVRRGPLEGRQVLLAAVRAADDPDHPWPALGLLALFDLERGLDLGIPLSH